MKINHVFFFFFFLSFGLYAQDGKFASETTFIEDVNFWLAKRPDSLSTMIQKDLPAVYNGLDSVGKTRIIVISRKMVEKQLFAPQLQAFWAIAVLCQKHGFSTEEMNKMLEVSQVTAEQFDYSAVLFSKYLYAAKNILLTDALFLTKSRFVLPTPKPTFSFGHTGIDGEPFEKTSEDTAATLSKKEEFDIFSEISVPKGEEGTFGWEDSPDYGKLIEEEPATETDPVGDTWGDTSFDDGWEVSSDGKESAFDDKVAQVGGPFIRISKCDLMIGSNVDTLIVRQTEGYINLLTDIFKGSGGKTDWKRVGLPESEVFCEFENYNFDVKKTELTVEDAYLTYSSKVAQKVKGIYEFKAISANKSKSPPYPRFMSYGSDTKINNVQPDVNFVGGFSLVGKTISSRNLDNSPSMIEVVKGGKVKFRAYSSRPYIFTDSTLTNQVARLVVYLNQSDSVAGKDSIQHLGVSVYYLPKKSELFARKYLKEFSKTPFQDSYHNVEIHADELHWIVDKQTIDISVESGYIGEFAGQAAVIESADFFLEQRINRMQTSSRFHPLIAAVAYSDKIKNRTFLASRMAADLKLSDKIVKTSLVDIGRLGYLDYNPRTDEVMVHRKGRLYTYALNRRVDFDNIFIASLRDSLRKLRRNMHIDLNNNDLKINGVKQFELRKRIDPEETKYKIGKEFWKELEEYADDFGVMELLTEYKDALQSLDGKEFRDSTSFKKAIVEAIGNDEVMKMGTAKYQSIQKIIFETARPDMLDIFVEPSEGKMTMKKNRDVLFDGKVIANGFANFYGKEFTFRYDSFKISMPTIDSIGFFMKDSLTGKLVEMSNKIKNASGDFIISNPKNKSGFMKISGDTTKYPVFNVHDGGMIGFGDRNILDGEKAYSDTLIHFDIEPYSLDDLTRHKPDETSLKGTFRTSGMFPDFEEAITFMPDKSFGFVHSTKQDSAAYPKGFPLYKDSLSTKSESQTAYFKGTIRLDNNGIRGSGNINYLTANLESNDFIYYPDSVTALSKHKADGSPKHEGKIATSKGKISAGVLEGISFPDVDMPEFRMNWLVKADNMQLSSTKDAFRMYHIATAPIQNDQASTFVGSLNLTPLKLGGNGSFDNLASLTKSPNFKFEQTRFEAKNADFTVRTSDMSGVAVSGKNVFVDYDMTTRQAVAKGEVEGEQSISFPYTQYSTSIAQATWFFDQKRVDLQAAEGTALEDTKFASTKPEQEGLVFGAKSADYDLKDYTLNINGVDNIFVVDSKVYPDSGKVIVRKNAEMDKLENARLVVSAENEHHKLDSGSIKIHSRYNFKGKAHYAYKNDVQEIHPIWFDNFEVERREIKISEEVKDSVRMTFAKTEIKEKQKFIKQAGIQYRGAVLLRADSTNLVFTGEFRMTDDPNSKWQTLDTASKEIKIDNTSTDVGNGMFFHAATKELYLAAQTPLKDKADIAIFKAKGLYRLDPITDFRIIEPKERKDAEEGTGLGRTSESYATNRFVYNKQKGMVEFDGQMLFFVPNENVDIRTSGNSKGNFNEKNYEMDCMLSINLPKAKSKAYGVMGKYLQENRGTMPLAVKYSNGQNHALFFKIANQLPLKEWISYHKDAKNGSAKLSDEFGKGICIANVKMKWSEKDKAWHNISKIGLANVMGYDPNLLTDGYMEISFRTGSPVLNVLIKFKETWFAFKYEENQLSALSSLEMFNAELQTSSSKDKINLMDESEKNKFINYFIKNYGEISEE